MNDYFRHISIIIYLVLSYIICKYFKSKCILKISHLKFFISYNSYFILSFSLWFCTVFQIDTIEFSINIFSKSSSQMKSDALLFLGPNGSVRLLSVWSSWPRRETLQPFNASSRLILTGPTTRRHSPSLPIWKPSPGNIIT